MIRASSDFSDTTGFPLPDIFSNRQKGSWELNLKSNLLTWDAAQYKIYGYEPGEVHINEEFFLLNTTHTSDIPRVTKIVKDALRNHEGYCFRRRIIKRNGTLGLAETHARIFRTDNGSPFKISGNTIDISGHTFNGVYDFNDPVFFKTFYENYKKTICSEIYRQTLDKELAEDLCQEVFVKAWKNMNQYNSGKAGIYSWLLNITRNHCIDYFRSKYFKYQKETTSLDHTLYDKNEISDDTANFIRELLKHLTVDQRELMDLLFTQGFTQQEVSKIKNLPLGTIKTNSRRAIKSLRQLAGISHNKIVYK